MRVSKVCWSVVLLLAALFGSVVLAQSTPPSKSARAGSATSTAKPMTDTEKAEMAERVRTETLHAWNGYKKYAWGHDALKPLSQKPIRLVWRRAQPVDDPGGCSRHLDADGAEAAGR